jgi:hypothetical protein
VLASPVRLGLLARLSHGVEIEAGAPCVSASDREDSQMAKTGKAEMRPEQELRERVACALARVDRLDATLAREKAYAEERAVVRAKAEAPTRRSWWRLGR